MNDRFRAQQLLAQAWERPPAYALERVEVILSALVHAVLATSEGLGRPPRDERAERSGSRVLAPAFGADYDLDRKDAA